MPAQDLLIEEGVAAIDALSRASLVLVPKLVSPTENNCRAIFSLRLQPINVGYLQSFCDMRISSSWSLLCVGGASQGPLRNPKDENMLSM